MNEIVSGVFSGVKDRTSGLYGYVAVTLLLFNWSNFYFLFFSTKTAEQKIVTLTKFFDIEWGFFIPTTIAVISYSLAPYINVGIKFIHTWAVLLEKDIDFKNKNYEKDLELKRELDIEKRRQEYSEIESKSDELLKEYKSQELILKEMHSELEEIRENESKILKSIADRTDELQKLDIKYTKEKQEYGNYEKLRDMFDELREKAVNDEEEAKNDKDTFLGLLVSIINSGYIPEEIEEIVNDELFELGYLVDTDNPLREFPRRYRPFIIDDFNKKSLKHSKPKEITIPDAATYKKSNINDNE